MVAPSVLISLLAFGEPDAIAFPITDPAVEPLHMGLGSEPGAVAALDTPTVLFVNFDGPFINSGCGNDSRNDCSTIFGGTQFSPSPADAATRAAVIQATREDVADFGVIVVAERPPEGNSYAMVVVGLPPGDVGNVGGVAPGIDCGNNNPNITSFSFLVTASANVQATVIHQEAAHTWGLEHVDDPTDNLFPSAGGTLDPKYNDVCSRIVANTDLDPTSSSCNQIHTLFCEPNFQNSYQEMLALFGPTIPDQTPPTVTIDDPLDGTTLDYEAAFDLTITLDDDRRPQVMQTIIYFDDVMATTTSLIDATHTFGIPGGDAPAGHGLSNGPHTITVEITDESGNPASDEITIVIEGNPAGDDGGVDETGGDDGDGTDGPDDGDGDEEEEEDDDDESGGDGSGDAGNQMDDGTASGCSCRTTARHRREGPAAAWALLALVSLGLRRRR